MKKVILLSFLLTISILTANAQKILFDNSTGESASNADWVIDADAHNLKSNWPTTTGGSESNAQQTPTPAQSGITSSTAETYWDGGISEWGVDIAKYCISTFSDPDKWHIETLPYDGLITYGDASNPQDLSNYKVFILDEPNSLFTSSEKTAIVNFVNDGGGLFLVNDHDVADRNNDGGDDAIDAINDLLTSSGGFNNGLGITIDYNNISETPSTNINTNLSSSDPLLHGPRGDGNSLKFNNGATSTINSSNNSTVKAVVFRDGYSITGSTGVMMAYVEYGNGRVVTLGDSSPIDDGTGDSGDNLYVGWGYTYNGVTSNANLAMNGTIWLMGAGSTSPTLSVDKSSITGYSYVVGNGPSSEKSFNISGSNLDGSQVTISAPTDYEISLTSGGTFSSSVNISYTAPTLSSTPVYVRLKAGLPVGTYNSENITCSDNGTASDVTVSNDGQVTNSGGSAHIIISEFADASAYLASFIEIYNAGTAAQDLSNWTMSENGSVTTTIGSITLQPCEYLVLIRGALTDLEGLYGTYQGDYYIENANFICNGDDYFELKDNSSNLIDNAGNSSSTSTSNTAYERKDANSDGTDISSMWNAMSNRDDATPGEVNVYTMANAGSCSAPTLSVSPSTLTGFSYVVGNGPSSSQSFSLSGTNLDGTDVTISAPSDYEISSDNSSFGNSITLSAFDGTATTIYVHLKASLSVGTYNNETISISGGGDTDGESVNPVDGEVTADADITLADNGTQIAAADVEQGTTKHVLHTFKLTVANASTTLNQVDFTSAGTYTTSDITKFQLWYSSSNDISGASQLGSDITATLGTGSHSFASLSQSLAVGTHYFWITTDINANATEGNTINSDAVATSGLTFANGTKSGSTSAGGAQTIIAKTGGCASDLIISEYGEGSSGNSKYIEIANFTGATVDLSNYQIWTVVNGGTWPENTYSFSTSTLADGATLVLANNNTDVPGADEYDGICSWNGDDGVGLAKNTGSWALIDVIGTDTDPGTAWDVAGVSLATKDHYLVRKSSITSPNTDWTASAGTTTSNSEWEVYSYSTGSAQTGHTMSCNSPELSASPSTLTGFSYIYTHGPSSSQSFDVSGSNLDGTDVTISAPSDYEVSSDNSSFSSSITLTAFDGTATTIYVHLKAGLSVGTYNNETISITGGGDGDGTTVNPLDGEVLQQTLSVDPSSLSGFLYIVGNGPSSSQSFDISGTNLDGTKVTITAPADYEISTDNSTFVSSLDVSYTAPTLSATTIYVRLKAGLSVGAYNNENVTCSDDGNAADVTVTLNGDVVEPTLTVNPTTLTGFTYSEGAGPSSNQTFDLSGSNLDGTKVTISAPTHYEISTDGSNFYASLDVSYTAPTLSATTIYVRLKAGLVEGTYNGEIITCSDDGSASDVQVNPVDGNVTAASASCASSLIISEYCEGSSNNKYIEIYNNTGAAVNLDDYRIGLITNGGSWTEASISFTAGTSLANATTWVLANSGASSTILNAADQTSGSLGYNGDDAVALQHTSDGGTTWDNIDLVGTDGAAGGWDVAGTSNATTDHTLVRKNTVFTGNTDWSASAGTSTSNSEWEVYTTDYFDNIGTHSMACTCEEPTSEATNLTFSNISDADMDLSWTNGNGTHRIVVACEGSPVSFSPTDGTTYSANSSFGSGTDLGSGNYVVFNGTANSFTITNLTPGTTYYFKIYEYGCQPGSEDYLTSGTPEEGNATTLPNDVANLQVVCATASTVNLSWDLPTGNYDAIVITALQGGTPPAPSCDGSTLSNPQTDYSAADIYCSNSANAVYVFNNIGTNVTITGLAAGQSYTFKAYVFINSAWSSGVAVTQTAEVSDVSNLVSQCGNEESEISWDNPNSSCFDEVIIAVNTSSVSGIPSGTYTANSLDYTDASNPTLSDGSVIVYNGTTSPQTITGLTNGTTYYFKVFVRSGSDWSAGTEVSCAATTATILDYGDLAIVGINTDTDDADATNDPDEIQFVCFKTITTETAIDMTDNGYERLYAGKWADSEGFLRFKRTGADLPAGTVITVQGRNAAANWHVFIGDGTDTHTLVNDDANWTITDGGSGNNTFDLNVNDQIWVMQGGEWNNPSGSHNSTYSGKVLYGWTAVGWEPSPGYDDTKGSTIFPGSECSQTNVVGVNNEDKVRYNDDVSAATQRDWLSRINDDTNWIGSTSTSDYNSSGTLPDVIDILSGGFSDIAKWTGETSTDWNDCTNWLNLKIPDASANVEFVSDDCQNDLVLEAGKTYICNNFSISGSTLTHSIKAEGGNSTILEIHGNLSISGPDNVLDFDDGSSADDAVLKLYGNWENNTGTLGFLEGNSTVEFKGTSTQTISSSSNLETFYNLTIDNISDIGVQLNTDVQMNGNLNLSGGVLNLNGKNIDIYGQYSRVNGVFGGNSSSDMQILGTGTLAPLFFAVPQELNNFVMNRSSETAELATNLTMENLTISDGIVQLDAGKFFTVNNTLTNSVGTDGFILKSDALGTASLIQNSENILATCERYIEGNVWAYIFSPLNAVPTSTFNGGNPNFYWYDEAPADYWDATTIYGTMGWTPENSANLSTDKGYISYYTNSRIYNLKGGNLYFDATNNNKIFTLTYNDSGTGAVNQDGVTADWDDFEGWNLLGNPFTSAIDWNKVSLNNVENVVYYYDGSNYKYFGGGTNYNQGITVNGGSQFIPANQGFFVKATVNNATLTIPNSARTHNSQSFWKSAITEPNSIIRLTVIANNSTDETVIVFDSLATDNHDNFDGYKLFSPNKTVPQIYSIDKKSAIYSINNMPIADNKIIPLGLFIKDAGTYSLNFTEITVNNYHVYFNDKQNNKLMNIQNIDNYAFTFDGGNIKDRFELIINKNRAPYNVLPLKNQILYVNDNLTYVLPNAFADADMGDYLTITASLTDGSDLPEWLSFNDNIFKGKAKTEGIYNIKVTATDRFGASTEQIFKITVVSTTSIIEKDENKVLVYPNPAKELVNIDIPNLISDAQITIFDASGKKVYSNKTSSKENTIDVSNYAKGVYLIEIRDDALIERQKLLIK